MGFNSLEEFAGYLDNLIGFVGTPGKKMHIEIVNESLTGGSKGYKPILTNWGYEVTPNAWFAEIENFGWRLDSMFFEKAIQEFEDTSKYGLKMSVSYHLNGEGVELSPGY